MGCGQPGSGVVDGGVRVEEEVGGEEGWDEGRLAEVLKRDSGARLDVGREQDCKS